jgi:hypothetical protein
MAVLTIAPVVPLLLMINLVARHGVDIPFADEWTLAPLFVKAQEHKITFMDLFMQWHEHRMVLPKLIFIACTVWAGGNMRIEMFLSVLLAAGSAINLLLILRRSSLPPAKLLLVATLMNLLVFSPVQVESWTWGVQLTVFLVSYLLTTGICIASSRLSIGKKFVACAVIAFLASFSFGNGMLSWGLTFPVAFAGLDKSARRSLLPWLYGWIITGLFTISAYFIGYTKTAEHPPLAASRHVTDYYLYVAAFVGAPLSRSGRAESLIIPVLLGTLLLIIYVSAVAYAFAGRRAKAQKLLAPWFALGAFALLSACMAALARIGFGLTEALASRSTTFGMSLSVAVVAIVAIGAPLVRSDAGSQSRLIDAVGRTEAAALALFSAMFLTSAVWGILEMKSFERTRLWGKGALHFGNVLDTSRVVATFLGGNAADVMRFARMDNSMGLLHPALAKSRYIRDLAAVRTTQPPVGFINHESSTVAGACVVSGWAVLPSRSRAADCVVLTLRAEGTSGEYAFAVNDELEDRPDVARKLGRPELVRCGWRVHFDRLKIPAGEQRIGAWALDANSGILYQLAGEMVLR